MGIVWDTSQYNVYYEDTDFSGFVYHANYLKFFERSREHLLGIDYLHSLFKDGFHFVVHEINMIFRAPARHGDVIVVETECHFSKSPAVRFKHVAKRAPKGEIPGTDLVTAEVSAVLLGAGNKPVRLPRDMIASLSARATIPPQNPL